jgi:hypothetical protein
MDEIATMRGLRCVDCGALFNVSAREQAFYSARALSQPKRCQGCRDARRREREASGLGPSYESQGAT